jgi:alanyl-tRNA synthetase
MTHVLNYALRKTLILDSGKAQENSNLCEQRGSLVDTEKLRFDFSWSSALSVSDIAKIESLVLGVINAKLPVDSAVVPLSAASKIASLRKVFGEAYPDPVRVVSVGVAVEELLKNPSSEGWYNVSIEFCGGTHLSNTANAEEFVIFEESGIAKGIRRISAFTRSQAKEARLRAASLLAKLHIAESAEITPDFIGQFKELRKEASLFEC